MYKLTLRDRLFHPSTDHYNWSLAYNIEATISYHKQEMAYHGVLDKLGLRPDDRVRCRK